MIIVNKTDNFQKNMQRADFIDNINDAFKVTPVVALLGPHQVGKTTLAKEYAKAQSQPVTVFDLEDITSLSQLENPKLALQRLKGLIVIDEIQRRPDLFPTLRVLVDEHQDRQFLILGSASKELLRQSSETLAGRISQIELTPFNIQETGSVDQLWFRGGFPKSYLAETDMISGQWRQEYIATFLERDIPNLGFRIPPPALRRFWMMLIHYHGQIFNSSMIANAMGSSHNTMRHYLDILTGTFMIRELQPWFENIKKRQVKSSKIYFRDSGILHSLAGLNTFNHLMTYPKLGTSWEGFALEEVIRFYKVRAEECYFWGIHNDAELDLLLFKEGQKLGFEVKYTDHPKITLSMQHAVKLLGLQKLYVVIPGALKFPLTEQIEVKGIEQFRKKSG